MEHEEAVQTMSAEKYLLGELEAADRESFEEHLFSCTECAMDVRAASEFIEHSRIVLSATPAASPASVAVSRPSRRSFHLWPVVAAATLVLLFAVVVYQNLVEYPDARKTVATSESPQLLPSATLVATRDGNVPELRVSPSTPVLLSIDIPDQANYASYGADLYGPGGDLKWSLKIPADQARNTVNIRVPGMAKFGDYTLVLRGDNGDDKGTEIRRYSFRITQK